MKRSLVIIPFLILTASAFADSYYDIRDGNKYLCTLAEPENPISGTKCNYQYSDNNCDRSLVDASCFKDGNIGRCTPKAWTGSEADCICAISDDDNNSNNPISGTKCNYQYSDSICDRSLVDASCFKDGKTGRCTPKAWTGSEADCICAN